MSEVKPPTACHDMKEQIFQECQAMAEYSFANGLAVPIEAANTIEEFVRNDDSPRPSLGRLVSAHQTLAALVKPALPRTILLLDKERKSSKLWGAFGPVSTIRWMMFVSLFAIVCFIWLAVSLDVTVCTDNILQSHENSQLPKLLFYISAAALGAGFAALYKADSYIVQGTFDPTYNTSYWIRFCLGLIAGLVLSVMVSDNFLNDAGNGAGTSGLIDPAFIRPLLAMLGGFSAELLYTILSRLVETVASLFQGSTKNLLNRKQQEAEAQLAASKLQHQTELAAKLVKLQQEIGSSANAADIQAKIDQLLSDVMPGAGGQS